MTTPKHILVIAAQEKDTMPGQRFRIEQYFDYLKEHNFICHLSPLINEKEAKILYSKGHILKKFFIIVKSFARRYKDLKNIKKNKYDAVFIYREALLVGLTYFEKMIKKTGIPIIYDFDDAIWLLDTSEANKSFKWLKCSSKVKKIIKLADLVIAGNNYLAQYAQEFNKNTIVIPTTINTDIHKPLKLNKVNKPIIIGWSGSVTTIKHFKTILPALLKLKEKYKYKVEFKVIGDENFYNEQLNIRGKRWSKEEEISDLASFDIGIMPLPDDEWSKGKCGFKALLYMSMEIPTVASPIGVNTQIITNGVNGLLASTEEEWVEQLSMLIESEQLRKQLGVEGRKTVVEKYSFNSNKEKWLNVFKSVLKC